MRRTKFGGSDRFEVRERLGSGGMGIVYRALDRERGEEVALKVLQRLEPAALLRFKREFRTLADVTHRNLVSLYELVSVGDNWFFTMELVHGVGFLRHVRGGSFPHDGSTPTLDTQVTPMRQRARLQPPAPETQMRLCDLDRLRASTRQLVEGVMALHDAGQLHRDLKPSNVLVEPDGRIVILDFGVATEMRPHGETLAASDFVGTPAYMAPELGTGGKVRASSDWYAVGVMLYEALTGRRPFIGTAEEIMIAKREADPEAPSAFVAGVPADLNALCTALLSRDPDARPGGAEVLERIGAEPPVRAKRPSEPDALIGRERQLDVLRRAFDEAAAGEPRSVFVHGQSGVGKTALVAQFLTDLRRRDAARILDGRCYERESVPYKALDSLIDSLCAELLDLPDHEVAELLPRHMQELARLFPVLKRLESMLDVPWFGFESPDPHEVRRRAFGALRELLARLAAERPLVLYIDDVQWGDTDSAALLREVLRPPNAPPVLLVVSYRSDDADTSPFLRTLLAEGVERIEVPVRRLALEDARTLARRVLERGGAPTDRAEAIAREADGNPFFVMELVRYALGRASDDTLDAGLADVVQSRLRGLPEPSRALLEVVAVAARPLPRAVVLRAAGLGAEGRAAIESLRAGHVLHTRGTRDADVVETYHDRIREAVANGLTAAAARDTHRRLARALIAEESPDAESIAVHLEAAGETARAAEQYGIAGDRAADAYAFERAAALYAHAMELAPAPDEQRSGLLARLADALSSAGRGAEAAEVYPRAALGAASKEKLRCLVRAAEELLRTGQVNEGVAALRELLPLLGMKLPTSPLRSLVATRVWLAVRGLRFKEHDASQVSPEQLARLDLCWSAAAALGLSDHILGAGFQARHLLESLRAGEPRHVGRALGLEAIFTALGGMRRRAKAERLIARAKQLVEQTRCDLTRAYVSGSSGLVNYQFCEWEATRREVSEGAELLRAQYSGSWWQINTLEMYVLWSLANLGKLGEMSQLVPEMMRESTRRGDLYAVTTLYVGLSNLAWLVRDDPDGARRVAEEALAGWSREGYFLQHYWNMQALTHADLYCGDGPAAWERARGHHGRMKKAHLLPIEFTRVEALHLRGRAAVAAAAAGVDRDALLAMAEREARGFAKVGSPYALAASPLQRAGVAAVRGDEQRAAELLREAIAAADRAQMRMQAASARYRLGALIGAGEGASLVADAEARFAAEGIRKPAAFADVFAPGFAT